MIRILLAEDHQIVREGIRALLNNQADIRIMAEAANGIEALEKIRSELEIDILLADINMPGMKGLELTETIKHSFPEVRVIILSVLDEEDYILSAFSSGVSGYLLKSISHEEMLFAIRHIASGGKYLCSELTFKLFDKFIRRSSLPGGYPEPLVELSVREKEVLSLVANGLTNQEIADKLYTSKRTIEGHRFKLLQKTNAKNTASLVKFAIRYGLLSD